jgi:uncharacterized membrane-anchored protein
MIPDFWKKPAFAAVVVLQLAALGWTIYDRTRLLETGRPLYLQCEPIDPRSLLSGDYVTLNYSVSRLTGAQLLALMDAPAPLTVEERVYIAFEKKPGARFHTPIALGRNLEELRGRSELILRAWVSSASFQNPAGAIAPDDSLSLRFGAEQYFTPQHEGAAIEREMANAYVELAVARDGDSALRKLFVNDKEVRFY